VTVQVRIERVVAADIERVFDAWTDAQHLSRWFVVEPAWTVKAASELRVGGSFRIEMDRGDGTVFVCWGEYLEIDRPRRLVFTWSSAVPAVRSSRVTIELEPRGSSTALILVHELLPDTPEGRAHEIGWAGTLDNLERFVAPPD
jgi:uncharacterized protein YndB with AHSA1/START domain